MSSQLLTSAEELLTKTNDPELRNVLEDYILEKKFVSQLAGLESNANLKAICKDRDEWEKVNKPESYKSYYDYSRFEKAEVYYLSEDNSDEVTLKLSWDHYSCGSSEREERDITIQKSWLWASIEERPWLKDWDREFMSSIKWSFCSMMDVKFRGEIKEEILSTLGIKDVRTLEGEALVEKLPLMKNWNLFYENAKKFNVGSCSEILDKTVVVKGKEINIKEAMLSFKNYSPEKIDEIFKALDFDAKQAKQKKEKEEKEASLKALTEKFSNINLKEIEEMLKLKKELNK